MSDSTNKTNEKFTPAAIEAKWQAVWEEKKIYQPDITSANSSHEGKKKFYNLNMFPYPSAEGLHVGNMYAFTGADIYGRYQRMNGFAVFQPMGLDGFGIHSENYALKIGSHPMDQAAKSEKNFYRQLHAIGNSYDWSRTVETWKPEYYRWTQWVFTELFKAGLAYRAGSQVNWCPSCKTVLADEQVIDGKCERCGANVEKRMMEQWFFRITHYAERLLEDLKKIDWTEKVKIAQRNWIGRSEGAEIEFQIVDSDHVLSVFTTRPDTLHGATFMVLSPEHPLVEEILKQVQDDNIKQEVRDYVKTAQSKTEAERVAEDKDKTGVFSGVYAINPVNNKQIPIWIADYVLMGYGTGAIMAVPAHDQRDFDFAKKYNLPIIPVIEPKYITREGDSAVKPDMEYVKREAVCAIVHDPKKDTYLCISWKEFKMNGLVTGGVEEGEDPIETALREIREETGYKNIRFVKDTNRYIHSLFYHRQKQQNRWARFHYLVFELENDEKDPVSTKESELLEVVWKSKNEFKDFFSVIEGKLLNDILDENEQAYTGEGVLANSGEWNGWETPEAKMKAIEWIEEKGFGQKKVQYHLRDWLISRQRYWGAPIPMIYCEKCAAEGKSWFDTDEAKDHSKIRAAKDVAGWYPEEQLPVTLPHIDDYRPVGTGKAPLANHPEFYETTCPACGSPARRETDVADTFLDSAWYFFRYPSTDIHDKPWDERRIQEWLPVDQYTGGAEHSVLHLLYSRFVTKVFHDLGYMDFDEPFPRFFAHGLIIKEGAKMSKSKGNVVVPDDYIRKYGADTLRTYLMFLGPFSDGGDFQDTGIEGIHRFMKRVWHLFTTKQIVSTLDEVNAKAAMHTAIKGVTEDVSRFRYNTAIAKIMTWYNSLSDRETISQEEVTVFLKLLAPFAPHMTEELYQKYCREHSAEREEEFQSIHTSAWPEYNESLLISDTVTIAVQVNGKLRDTLLIEAEKGKNQEEVEKLAKESEKVLKFIEGKDIRKAIFVPGKILNLVV